MEIRYRTDESGIEMRTKCPFGMKKNGHIIYVASGACAMCKFYMGERLTKKIVYCNNGSGKS